MKLKWLSMLLALALVFSLAPAMALAEEVSTADALQAAIASAKSGDMIKLTAGIEYNLASLGNALTINKSLTIICEGGTATFKGDPESTNGAIVIPGGSKANVTLQNINFVDFGGQTQNGSVITAGETNNAFAGKLTISNCEISNFGKNGITVKGGTATISKVTVDVSSEGVSNRAPNGIQIDINAAATITDCMIKNSKSTAEKWDATGILTLRGGTTKASNITFENCESAFSVEKYYDNPNNGGGNTATYTTSGAASSISGSTFTNCERAVRTDTGETIGGNGGTWTPSSSAALSTEVINQLPEGTTIKLKDNIELNAMLDIQQDGITLDLGEHTITASDSFTGGQNYEKHLVNVQGENVTIKNGTLKTTNDNRHALNLYNAKNVNLSGLTLDHTSASEGAPIVVGASTVTVSDKLELITGTTSWYGMNIDSNIANTESSVTFNKGSNLVFGGSSNIGIRIDDEGTLGGALSLTFSENMDISVPNIDNFIVVRHLFPEDGKVMIAPNSSLKKDEDGNYILAQNPEVTPPTPPTSGGGWDDTLWPNILQHPQSVSAPAGSLATFSVVANGGPLSYQWQVDRRDGKGFVSIPGATGATLTVGPVTGTENGYQYRCAVTLYGATMYSGAGQLFVTAGMIPKTGDMPGSPALLLALASLGLAAWVVARRRAG